MQGCQVGLLGRNFRNLVPNNTLSDPDPKIFILPFGSFWPFSRIGCLLARIDHPGSCLRNLFFTFLTINCRFSRNSYILKVFHYKILLGSLELLSYVKVSSSECLLLAAVVEVGVRTVTVCYLT